VEPLVYTKSDRISSLSFVRGRSSDESRAARRSYPITLAVAGLDALLERLAAQRIEHEPIETYSNGVRPVNVPDPDGNAIAFAEPPDTANA
jgi:hypothetical protein